MKSVIIFIFILVSAAAYSQRPSESVKDKNIYGSDTEWSCSDKHFGYYFISYSLPMPIEQGLEKEIASHNFNLGYTYRYKVVPMVDVGAELAYANRTSSIQKESISEFDPGTFYNKINTYHNSISSSLYFRFNLAKSDYRHLGLFADIGGDFCYAIGYGTQYILNNSSIYQKARFKKPEYLNPLDYSVFVRAGYNNIALIASYSFGTWIDDFSTGNVDYGRSPLLVGIQMNLYAK